uniref:TetR/AcrR family transcriptional regulator n=1 Tax=Caballeronia cordobensis TaxID=1353886 RepID=UPI000A6D4A84
MDSKPPKSVVKRDPEGTRRRILEAAKSQFAKFGLAGARVDAIAEVAGSNQRMLYYYYFGSKERLYVAVLE